MSGVLKLKSAAAVKAKVADTPAVEAMRTVRVKVGYEAAVARRAKRAKRSVHDTCVTHRGSIGNSSNALPGDDKPLKIGIEKDPFDLYGVPDKAAASIHDIGAPASAPRSASTSRVSRTSPPWSSAQRASISMVKPRSKVTAEAVQPMETVQ